MAVSRCPVNQHLRLDGVPGTWMQCAAAELVRNVEQWSMVHGTCEHCHRAGSQYDDRNPLCAKIAVVVHVKVNATRIIARFTKQGALMFVE